MIIELAGVRPSIAEDVYIAPTAVVIGNVTILSGANIWFGAVLRGDSGRIVVGRRVSVQDNVVVHVNERADTIIGDDVLLGHGAILEGCRIGAGALIGMGATVLSGAHIGERTLVAAGSLVREGSEIPAEVLAAGVPATVRGELAPDQVARLARGPQHYQEMARLYAQGARVIG